MLYFFIFFLIFSAGLLDIHGASLRFRRAMFFFFMAVLMVLGSIRWKTGTDWISYSSFFVLNNTYRQYNNWGFEQAYVLLNFLVKSITPNYSVFLSVFAVLTISIKILAFSYQRYTQFLLMILLLYFAYTMGDIFPVRQSLALSITLFSGRYIIERKLLPFLICVYITTQFHASGFVFIFAYPIAAVNLSTRTVAFILIGSVLLGYYLSTQQQFEWLAQIPGLSDHAAEKLQAYTSVAGNDSESQRQANNANFWVGLIRKTAVLVPLLIYRRKLEERYDHFSILFNIVIFGAVFYFTLGTMLIVLKRAASYFDLFEIAIIPMFVFLGNNALQRFLIYLCIALYALAKLYFVVNNYWDLYVPFYSIFDEKILRVY